MRTLVVSDLHLGSRMGRDVLRLPAAFEALVGALDGIDRLVLLGDVVELLEGRPQTAMDLAEPVLRELGGQMGRGREILVLAGNHDHALVRPWLRERRASGRGIGLTTRVPARSGAALERLVSWLRPAKVSVHYPGVRLRADVWAHHGHYADRHLVPSQVWGGRRLVGTLPPGRITAEDYERATGPSAAALQGLLATTLPPFLGAPLDQAAGLLRRASYLALPTVAGLGAGGALAPLSAGVLGYQFRRAGLPAMADVALRLRVRADHVIFGHLHRAGPREGDHLPEWAPRGRHRLHNTGCWVYEPLLLAGASPPHPYWPGGAVLVEDTGPPVTLGLLDGVDERHLR